MGEIKNGINRQVLETWKLAVMQTRIAVISCLTLCPCDGILGQELSLVPADKTGMAIA
tara:strand:- start:82555 stop:82728 length:174 start_codon:yes stop_codon:yes gene_type:complete